MNKKFSDYVMESVEQKFDKSVADLYDTLSMAFSGIKNIESSNTGISVKDHVEFKRIKSELKQMVDDVKKLFSNIRG